MDKLDICLFFLNFAIMIIFVIVWGIARMITQNFTEAIPRSIFNLLIVVLLWRIMAAVVSSQSVLYLSGIIIIIAGIAFDIAIKNQFGIHTSHRSLKRLLLSFASLVVILLMISTYHRGLWGETELGIVEFFCSSAY